MSVEEIKKKISWDLDSNHELSEELKVEIQSNKELREFADDLIKIASLMEMVKQNVTTTEKEIKTHLQEILENCSQTESDNLNLADNAKLFAPPLPQQDGEKEEGEDKEQKEQEEEQQGLIKMKTVAVTTTAEGDSSGLINLGALIEEHRKSTLPASVAEARIAGKTTTRTKWGTIALIVVIGVIGVVAIALTGKFAFRSRKYRVQTPLPAQKESFQKPVIMVQNTEKKQNQETIKAQQPVKEETSGMVQQNLQNQQSTKVKKRHRWHPARAKEDKPPTKKSKPVDSSAGYPHSQAAATAEQEKKKEGDLLALLDEATAKKTEKKNKEKQASKSSAPSVEELMGENQKHGKTEQTRNANLPATLSKNQIKAVMRKLNPKINRCGEGKIGTLILNLVVNNDGTVKSVKVTGQFASDPVGKCAANVAKTAKFPPFTNPTANVTYPYIFAPPAGE